MMLLLFLIVSILISVLIVLFKNKTLTRILTVAFALLLIWFTIFAWTNLNRTELTYFTFDSTGVLLLSVLALLAITYHLSRIYLHKR